MFFRYYSCENTWMDVPWCHMHQTLVRIGRTAMLYRRCRQWSFKTDLWTMRSRMLFDTCYRGGN